MRRFLENACLLGGAIIIWLSILGAIISAVTLVYLANTGDSSGQNNVSQTDVQMCAEGYQPSCDVINR